MTPPLGIRLRDERLRRGWSQAQVAAHFSVGQSAISRWESGTKRPADELLPKVAEFLGASVAEVVLGKAGHDDQASDELVDLRRRVALLEADNAALRQDLVDLVTRFAGELRQVNDQLEAVCAALARNGAEAEPSAVQ